MTEVRQIVVENLKTICKLRNIKNIQIAEHMGVSQGSVTNWFRGTNSIDIDNLYKLCNFLGVSLDQIFGITPLNPEVILTDEEAHLISAYRSAEPSARQIALETLVNHPQKKENAAI